MPGRTTRRTVLATLALAVVAGAAALAAAHRPAIGEVPRPDPASFASAEVERGHNLVLLGNCGTCHQAGSEAAFAGGLALATPFGTLYSANITPDERTGIGTWSREAFRRAMRDGVSRDGHHLYPALPYEHFTRVDDADLGALYAYLMTRPPVAATPPANKLIPPFGFRPLLAGWKWLFLRPGVWQPTAGQSGEWNRGAYLSEGLAHCGACHTPRDLLGAEERDAHYDGGWAEGWYSPAINERSPARRAWTTERLAAYLRTGLDTNHAAAAGPMGPVTYNLARAPEADVWAIALYSASLMAAAPAAQHPDVASIDRRAVAEQDQSQGAALYASACAACHDAGAPMMSEGRPSLSLGSALWADDPRDTIAVMLRGLRPPTGRAGPYMPAFGDVFGDAEIGALAAYIRARYSDRPAWSDVTAAAQQARKETAAP